MTHLQVILLILCQSIFTFNYINCEIPQLNYNDYDVFRQGITRFVAIYAENSSEFTCTSVDIKSAQQQEDRVNVTSIVAVDCDIKDQLCPISKQLNCYLSFTFSEGEGYVADWNAFNCTPVIVPEFANCQTGQPGCPFDLNVNARGVSTFTNAALAQLRHERMEDYRLMQTLRLQRQVLETVRSGVKYYLTIEVVRAQGGENEICYLTFLEKPLLDDNARHIISNNCTYNQEYTATFPKVTEQSPQQYHRNDQNNEIDVNYSVTKIEPVEQTKENPNFEQIAQSGNADEMYGGITASRVREIESQVLPNTYFSNQKIPQDKKQAIDGLLDVFNFDVEPKLKSGQQGKLDAALPTEQLKPIEEPIIVPVRAVVAFQKPLMAPKIETVIIGVADSETIQNTTENEDEATAQRRRKRDLSSSKQLQPTTPDESILVENLSELAVNTLDNIDADNHRRVVLKILGSKKSISDGITYHLTLKVGISECMEENTANTAKDLLEKMVPKTPLEQKCRNTLLSDLTMICKVQVYVTEKITYPKVVKSQCQNLKRNGERNNRTGGRFKRAVPGGLTPLDTTDNDFFDLVEDALKKLDELSEEPNGMKIINIKNATKQVVAGMSYKITAEVGLADLPKSNSIKPSDRINAQLLDEPKSKVCIFSIWDRPWLPNGKETSIVCDPTTKVSFRSKRAIHKLGGYGDDHEIHLGLFNDFMQKYNKTYSTKIEYKRRFNVFKQNLKKIREFKQYEQGTAKYGPTIFADLTRKEFQQYLGYNPNLANGNNLPLPLASIPDINLPDSVDWRKEGAVTEVKNQGQCGSCWAFSVTGNVEGQYFIKNHKLVEFSEQELVDCDKLDDGCNGGLMDNAYRSIEKMGGLETETDYPYEAENDKCTLDSNKIRVQLKGAVNITSDEVGMAKWLAANGPISIALNANAMQFYMGGVSHPWKVLCNPKQLDHGVLIVGYGTSTNKYFNKTMPYWIIKNSWGKHWGEQGYYRLYRGSGTCGVNQTPSSAILAD